MEAGLAKHAQNGTSNSDDMRNRAAQASSLLNARMAARRAQAGGNQAPAPMPDRPPQGPRERGRQIGGIQLVRRNVAYIVGVVAVVAIVAVGLLIAKALLSDTGASSSVQEEYAYTSPYDWTKLDRTDGRYRYIVDGEVKSRIGVDVSENQHDIDWNAVAADGIDFAMVRLGYRGVTEGDLYVDGCYERNIDGARAAGLKVGVYFFSQACTPEEAVEEADFVVSNLAGRTLGYPVAFDSETVALSSGVSRTSNLSNDEMTAIYQAFCNRIEEAGYSSIVYGNALDLARYRYDDLKQDRVWWAEYGVAQPNANIDIVMWQYSNGGSVAGISTAVDMNIDLRGVLS